MKAHFVVAAVAVATAACVAEPMDVESARKAGRGTEAIYDAPADEVWIAAHDAIHWAGVGKATDHPNHWSIVTDPEGADQVGIWLEPEGDRTRVRVIVMDNPALPGPYESQVQHEIAKALRRIEAQRTVPARAPVMTTGATIEKGSPDKQP